MTPFLGRVAAAALPLVLALALAVPAQAIYIETPLHLSTDDHQVYVGDDLDLHIRPNPDQHQYQADWAGRTVHVRFSYDQNEGGAAPDPDAPTSDEGVTLGDIARDVLLDANATATVTWRVPAAVDNRNVDVFVESLDGERLAFAYLTIGDAVPMARITMDDADDGREPALDGEPETGGDAPGPAPSRDAPAFGVAAIMALLGASAIGIMVLLRRA